MRQLIRVLRSIRLRDEEKVRMRNALLYYIQTNPVRNVDVPRPIYQMSSLFPLSLFRVITSKPMYIPAIILVLSLMGGGVSYAAEGSVPGDLLYPIKVRLNEEVRSAVAFTPRAKAEWAVRRTERRLEEAQELLTQNRLNQETRLRLEEGLGEATREVRQHVEQLTSRGNAGTATAVSSELEAILRAERTVFENTETAGPPSEERTRLMARIEEAVVEAGNLRAGAVSRAESGSSQELKHVGEEMRESARETIRETERLLQTRAGRQIDEKTREFAESRLREAARFLEQGEARLGANAHADALGSLQQSLFIGEEVRTLIEARERTRVDVSTFERAVRPEATRPAPSEAATAPRTVRIFEECVAAGHSIRLTQPRTCRTPEGTIFSEPVERPSVRPVGEEGSSPRPVLEEPVDVRPR